MTARAPAAVLVVLLVALGAGAHAADDAPTDVPDPVGLGERLALIDYLQNHGQQVEQGADLASLRTRYRALTAKAAPSPEQAARDAAALELWRTYGESATPEETLAQIRARLDALAAKAAAAHQQEVAREADDSRAADAAAPQPKPPANGAAPAAGAPQPKAPGALTTTMPPPTGKPGADGAWIADMPAAIASAKDLKRPLIIALTGADWGEDAAKLDQEVLGTREFAAWAAGHVVLARAEVKQADLQNTATPLAQMCQRLELTKFPTVLVVNANGEAVGKLPYVKGGVALWIEGLSKLLHF